jgi:hypothetical protein
MALSARHPSDLTLQYDVLQRLDGVRSAVAFNAVHANITLHGSLLTAEQHAAVVIAAAPYVPTLTDLHGVFFRAGGGEGGEGSNDGEGEGDDGEGEGEGEGGAPEAAAAPASPSSPSSGERSQ